ncbi:MAG: hypothetical protein IID45_15405, partial [Planctomycetes bacterium]|nr:hypothetical protein [Planctomycetota bacterium]
MATFLEAMNAKPPDLKAAVQCLDPTDQEPDAWGIRGPTSAEKLKAVMDRTRVVVLPEVPDDPDGPPYSFYTGEMGNIVIGRIEEATADLKAGEWRFTPHTLKTLDALYEQHM